MDFVLFEPRVVIVDKAVMLRPRYAIEPLAVAIMTNTAFKATKEKTFEHDQLRESCNTSHQPAFGGVAWLVLSCFVATDHFRIKA